MHVFDSRKSVVRVVDIPFGFTMYLCWADAYCAPVGFVWGIAEEHTHGVFEVLGSYVEPWCRRQGVRTRINEAIFKDYPTIATAAGTEDGEAFMKAKGYRFNAPLHRFFKSRPEPKTKKGK